MCDVSCYGSAPPSRAYRYENAVWPPLKDWRAAGIFGHIKDQHTFPNFTHSPVRLLFPIPNCVWAWVTEVTVRTRMRTLCGPLVHA